MTSRFFSRIRGNYSRFSPRPWSVVERAAGAMKSALALVGGVVTVGAVGTYFAANQEVVLEAEDKRVLVLPFHRMAIVEQISGGILSRFNSPNNLSWSNNDKITVEVHELVNVIHEAAADPNIVALYGTFDYGVELGGVDWAHLEEVRNALKVFRESHRTHPEPNFEYKKTRDQSQSKTPKPLYAFAASFPIVSSGNQGYYLASAFTHIHLQPQGTLQLYGLHNTTFFIKELLDTYGIKADVLKHGDYKNAPNMFTEKRFTREHKENVENVLTSVNRKINDDIAADRGLSSISWKMVHNHGSLSAQEAKVEKFVDYLTDRDPLDSLMESTASKETRATIESQFSEQTNFDAFTASKMVSFKDYAQIVARRKRIEAKKWKSYKSIKYMAENSTAAKAVLRMVGYQAPYYNMKNNPKFSPKKAASLDEKIAVIRINNTITDDVARKVSESVKEIKRDKNVKAVILRVDSPGGSVIASERIFQEFKVLSQPMVCSFGPVAASGGYYVSAGAARIFALPTTLTGSIGVYGVRFDISGLAQNYGVKMGYVSSGKHAAVNDPFHPLTKVMKTSIQGEIDRSYDHFKLLVSQGRSLSPVTVEQVARGRVWTGMQAKENGLVDELGGLERAISYAQRHYTNGGAVVEFWPKVKDPIKRLIGSKEKVAIGLAEEFNPQFLVEGLGAAILKNVNQSSHGAPQLNPFGRGVDFAIYPHIYMTADENLAILCLLSELTTRKK